MKRVGLILTMLLVLGGCGGGGGGAGVDSSGDNDQGKIDMDNAGGWSVATMGANSTVSGTLQPSDIHLPDATYADLYAVTLPSATTLTIRLESGDFDAYLFLFEEGALDEADLNNWRDSPFYVAEDDDSGGGETNAEISVSLNAGTYLIVANSFDTGAAGTYTLTTSTTGPADPDPAPGDNPLSLDKAELNFSHLNGLASQPANQPVAVQGSGTAWSASVDQSWVVLSATSGVAPSTLEIGVDPAGLDSGSYSATVTVSDAAAGTSATCTVNLVIEQHKLFVGDNGVAFASFPTAPSRLSHSVTVSDNAGLPTAWTASSDQSWLSVTGGGLTDGPLTLTADPSRLTADSVHYATVTVSSSDSTIEAAETIKVGFYVAGSNPTATELPINARHVAADPIRPYAYVTYENAVVDTYHIYTGAKVNSLPAGSQLKEMTISSDGQTLFIIDGADSTIVPVDIASMTAGAKWDAACFVRNSDALEYTRFNGMGVVLTSQYEVFSVATGAMVASLPFEFERCFDSLALAATPDGRNIYGVPSALSGYVDLNRYTGSYSAAEDTYNVSKTHSLNRSFSNARDVAVSADGSKIYTASSGEYKFPTFLFDGEDLYEGVSLPGASYPNAVEIGPTGIMYGGAHAFGAIDVWSYHESGAAGATFAISGRLHDRQVRVSGDGLRLITLGNAPALTLTGVSP